MTRGAWLPRRLCARLRGFVGATTQGGGRVRFGAERDGDGGIAGSPRDGRICEIPPDCRDGPIRGGSRRKSLA
jgi:hypothetical protein